MSSNNEHRGLHSLEVMALQELPWKHRIQRIAALCREGVFGQLSRGKRSKRFSKESIAEVCDAVGEPWGQKGKFREELSKEIDRQIGIVRKRASQKRNSFGCHWRKYTPDLLFSYDRSPAQRTTSLVRKRLGSLTTKMLGVRVKASNSAIAVNILDSRIRDGKVYGLFIPSAVFNGHAWNCDIDNHGVIFLLVKTSRDGKTKAIRVSRKTRYIDTAIDSLKKSTVKTAEKKGDIVEIDWENRCFKVRSPKRKKWRTIPFKKWTRQR